MCDSYSGSIYCILLSTLLKKSKICFCNVDNERVCIVIKCIRFLSKGQTKFGWNHHDVTDTIWNSENQMHIYLVYLQRFFPCKQHERNVFTLKKWTVPRLLFCFCYFIIIIIIIVDTSFKHNGYIWQQTLLTRFWKCYSWCCFLYGSVTRTSLQPLQGWFKMYRTLYMNNMMTLNERKANTESWGRVYLKRRKKRIVWTNV